jgi:hypothetical protein
MAAVESLSKQVKWPERGSGFVSGEQSWNCSSRSETSALDAHKKPWSQFAAPNQLSSRSSCPFQNIVVRQLPKILAEPAFPLTPLDASHVETGRPPTTAQLLATAIQVQEQEPRNGHHAGRNPILFRHEIRASLVPWTRLLNLPRSKPMSSDILIIF